MTVKMYGFRNVGVGQVMKWKQWVQNRVNYHSGVGVFGHRPQYVNETGMSTINSVCVS